MSATVAALLTLTGCTAPQGEAMEPNWQTARVAVNLSIHLEGKSFMVDDAYDRFADNVIAVANQGYAHGARFTFESQRFTQASLDREDDILATLTAAGHAVAVHADLWGELEGIGDYDYAVDILTEHRADLATLGIDATHVSGICGDLDWIGASREAGFRSAGGMIGWCAVSLEEDLRPEVYDDCTDPASCHDIFLPLEQRLSLWTTQRTGRWIEAAPKGALTIAPVAVQLSNSAEHTDGLTGTGYPFTQADLDTWFAVLDEALALAEDGELRTLSTTWSMGIAPDAALFEQWLERIDAYVQRGEVTWATVPQLVEHVQGETVSVPAACLPRVHPA